MPDNKLKCEGMGTPDRPFQCYVRRRPPRWLDVYVSPGKLKGTSYLEAFVLAALGLLPEESRQALYERFEWGGLLLSDYGCPAPLEFHEQLHCLGRGVWGAIARPEVPPTPTVSGFPSVSTPGAPYSEEIVSTHRMKRAARFSVADRPQGPLPFLILGLTGLVDSLESSSEDKSDPEDVPKVEPNKGGDKRKSAEELAEARISRTGWYDIEKVQAAMRAAWEHSGLTQESVGLRMGLKQSEAKTRVSKLLNGQQNPTLETLLDFARAVGVPPGVFFK